MQKTFISRHIRILRVKFAKNFPNSVNMGFCNSLSYVEPLGGKRYVSASPRRTRQDWAKEIKSIVTEQYPQAEKVVMVMDNLNRHTLVCYMKLFRRKKRLR
jgi:hypothetical protein